MSWDPNAAYDNSAYGNYDFNSSAQQQQWGQQHQQHQHQASYDLGPDPYVTPTPAQNFQGQFYDPNAYGYGPQTSAAPPPQPQGPPPGPTPGPPGATQQQQPTNFAIPGLGEQVNPVVANMAMQYGQDIVGKGQEEIKKNLDKYVSIGQLKYYFAVDNSYVGKKLALLLFPFSHADWSIQYSQDEPVQPKFDVNAPDLYIPTMAYVTYVLLVGYVLGIKNAFSPDQLATTASSALVWLVLELGCVYLSLTLMSVTTNLCKWDILSFSTYKYVGITAIIIAGLVAPNQQVHYAFLAYIAGAMSFFLVRTLKLRIEPEVHGMQTHGKRKLYMLLLYAGLQPLFMWWMTSYLVPVHQPQQPPQPLEL